MGLLRYNPAKMVLAFSAYYRDELHRKVRNIAALSEVVTCLESTVHDTH